MKKVFGVFTQIGSVHFVKKFPPLSAILIDVIQYEKNNRIYFVHLLDDHVRHPERITD